MARLCPHRAATILTPNTRARWRAYARQLDIELLRSLVAEGEERQGLLAAWVASKEPLEDEKLVEAIVKFVLEMRASLLQELLQKFGALRERDTARMQEIYRAAQSFQQEFEALVAAEHIGK
jgi:hypothetical protein